MYAGDVKVRYKLTFWARPCGPHLPDVRGDHWRRGGNRGEIPVRDLRSRLH